MRIYTEKRLTRAPENGARTKNGESPDHNNANSPESPRDLPLPYNVSISALQKLVKSVSTNNQDQFENDIIMIFDSYFEYTLSEKST
jgi:hypothetical protein